MNISCLLFGLIMAVCGLLFWTGHGHKHIRAWKQMSEAERAQIRILPLCRNIGGMLFLCSALLLLSGLSATFRERAFHWGIVLWMLLCIADLYWIEKSGRYRADETR